MDSQSRAPLQETLPSLIPGRAPVMAAGLAAPLGRARAFYRHPALQTRAVDRPGPAVQPRGVIQAGVGSDSKAMRRLSFQWLRTWLR